MLAVLSSRQVSEWMAYHSLEPFGEQEAWWRAGQIAMTFANVMSGSKGKTFEPEDFMLRFERPVKVQTIEEHKAMLIQIFEGAKRAGKTKDG